MEHHKIDLGFVSKVRIESIKPTRGPAKEIVQIIFFSGSVPTRPFVEILISGKNRPIEIVVVNEGG
jgi:hypothetical protein